MGLWDKLVDFDRALEKKLTGSDQGEKSFERGKDLANSPYHSDYGLFCDKTAEESLEFVLRQSDLTFWYRDYRPSCNESFLRGFREGAMEMKNKLTSEHNESLDKYSLSCKKCDNLAVPVEGTERHYHCKNCGHRFTAANHPF